MILDIESELTQYSNLVNGLTDISNSIGTIAAIFGVGIIIIIPIIFRHISPE